MPSVNICVLQDVDDVMFICVRLDGRFSTIGKETDLRHKNKLEKLVYYASCHNLLFLTTACLRANRADILKWL